MDETANSGPERLLLVRSCGTTGVVSTKRTRSGSARSRLCQLTDPDQIPVRKSGQAISNFIRYAQLVGANIPVRGLNARRESCTNTGAGANANSALVERGCVRDTGKLRSNYLVSLKGIGGKNGKLP